MTPGESPVLYSTTCIWDSASSALRRRSTPSQIKAFARQFDPQPFHLDEHAAKETFFGGLAASGWHVAALTMKLLVEGGAPFAGGLIGAGSEIAWPKPTRPGDVLQVTSEVLEITPSRSRPDRGMVTWQRDPQSAWRRRATHDGELVVPRRGEGPSP